MPIPVHPETHPLLKMKSPDAVVPAVRRDEDIPVATQSSQPPAAGATVPVVGWDFRSEYAPRDGYNPFYLKGNTCMAVPCATGGQVPEESAPEDDRATTPRQNEKALDVEETQDEQPQDPFSDPAPMIAPITGVAGSMVSSFTASLDDRMKNVADHSPLAEAADRERSLFEGFMDRPKLTVESEKEVDDAMQEQHPSFVNDVLEDFFKSIGKPYVRRDQPLVNEPEMQEKKGEGVSVVRNLVPAILDELLHRGTVVEPEDHAEPPVEKEDQVLDITAPAVANIESEKTEDSVDAEDAVEEVTSVPTLSAVFVSDVTVPDGQVFPPGAEFVKCWKMVNDGSVDWPENTEVAFVAGQPGLASKNNMVSKVGAVKSGEQVDVWTGELKAPEAVGRYVGYWRLRNGETKEVFGSSIWCEIEVAEADHFSDETGSMSGSSIVMMPAILDATAPGAASDSATSVRPESVTLTIPSSNSTTTDGDSDMGSEGSLIEYMSDGEVVGWEDARSRQDGLSVAETPVSATPGSPLGDEFELVYDSSSDM